MKKLFTSESVTEGHPDKLCDLIADSILDAYLEKDEMSRVACEVIAGKNIIFVTGEITSKADVDIERIIRQTIKEVGYDSEESGIDYKTCQIQINISKQSSDIALGVDNSLEKKKGEVEKSEGAGDQGMVFGYACDETPELTPLPISLAHKLAQKLADVRKNGEVVGLRPDGKVQVTVEYEDDVPTRVDTIVISAQHKAEILLEELKVELMEKVIKAVIPTNLLDNDTKYYINPTGRFVIGGPLGDSGLTGRKIIVDTYGGYARHGGGAFSGKDATKVDRTGSYMARYVAKNIVANHMAKRCEIQISYAIGVAKPVSIYLETYGTSTVSEEKLIEKIKEKIDFTPTGMINFLGLRKPIYSGTTNYGHFGKENLPWEKINKNLFTAE